MHRDVSGTTAGRRPGPAGSGLPEALVALLLLAIGLLAGASGLLGAIRGSEAALLRSRATLHAGEFVEAARVAGAAGSAVAPGTTREAWVADWRSAVVETLPRGAADAEATDVPVAGGLRATLGWDDPDGHRAGSSVHVVRQTDMRP